MRITFCGHDIDENGDLWEACPEINIWFDPYDRSKAPRMSGKARRLRKKKSPIIAKVNTGDSGILLDRSAEYCKVEVDGRVGWLAFFFIEELKSEWLKQRRATRAMERLEGRRLLLNVAPPST